MNLNNLEDTLEKSLVLGIPASVHYIPNFLTKEEEQEIIEKVNHAPLPKWTQLSHRRLQNWGGIPHAKGMVAEEIPKWLDILVEKVASLDIFEKSKRPNHILINEYLPGQGIMAHTDGPLFYPLVATISCGSHILLEFFKSSSTENQKSLDYEFSLLLEPRSLLILQKDLYHNYLHAINERTRDIIVKSNIKNLSLCSQIYQEGQVLERSTRLSLTIRHVPKTSKLVLKFGR